MATEMGFSDPRSTIGKAFASSQTTKRFFFFVSYFLPLNRNNTKIMQSIISHNPLSHPILFLKRRIQACSWRRVFHQIQKYILSLLSTSILP